MHLRGPEAMEDSDHNVGKLAAKGLFGVFG